ncbi:sigma-70 family RNA polymerase sigma factor [Antrihabitans stalactiti]|nr:sigma-70 family RNA polymerase sigma factor [Antrihabitans stalactiti]
MIQDFERHRAQLSAVAYRMLGSKTDAEDAVQEAWLRLDRNDGPIDNMGAWLTTVVGRVCLDMLRRRRSRPEHVVDDWPVETVADARSDPESQAVLADSVGLALLVVLDTLSPSERLAFVLHDMFGMSFDDIAPMVDRTPTATRQLASRARRRVQGEPAPHRDLARERDVVVAFLAAARNGDFDALVTLLHPDVVFNADIGRRRPGLDPEHMVGAADVARLALRQKVLKLCEPALVDGGAGVRVPGPKGLIAFASLHIVDGRITSIDLVLDPEQVRAAHR